MIPIARILTMTDPISLTHKREEIEFEIRIQKKFKSEKKKCMAPLTLYSSNEKPTPERSRKNAWPALMVPSWIGLRITESPYKQLGSFANSRHCLGRMRYEEERKEMRRGRGAKF
jgi:hypothetical protein